MAGFFTRIRIDKSSIVAHKGQKISGEFSIDIEELNIGRRFRFVKKNSLDCSRCKVVLYKDRKIFLSHRGVLSEETFSRYCPEKGLILSAFYIIYRAYKNQLLFAQYAYTRVEYNSISVLVTATTPDKFRVPFIKACL